MSPVSLWGCGRGLLCAQFRNKAWVPICRSFRPEGDGLGFPDGFHCILS